MIYSKVIPIKHEADVFVAGGGPAGIAAAVAAARQGKSVFLAEAHGAFGGAGTTGLVPAFMNFCDGVHFLAGGIGREIHDAITTTRTYGLASIPIEVEQLKRLYDDMILQAGVKFSFFTNLIDVAAENGRVDHVILAAKSGVFAVKAKIYIDCTGDGDLCAWAGANFEMGNEEGLTMPSTLCSLWSNIDYSKVSGRNDAMIEKAIEDGVFTNADRHLPGMWKVSVEKGVGGGNIGHCFAIDSTDEESLTEAMLWGRKSMLEYDRYYREYLTGYENMHLTYTADMLGIRESRRILGDYVLNYDDYNARAVFEDEIGRYRYPVDIHIMKPNKEAHDEFVKDMHQTSTAYKAGESYGIPYRTLTPDNLSNILVAGRCISSDRKVQSSIRVMPCCYITGQAAGVAASLSCKKEDIRDIDIKELQKKLVDMGGFLPNA